MPTPPSRPSSWDIDRDKLYESLAKHMKKSARRQARGNFGASVLDMLDTIATVHPVEGTQSGKSVFGAMAEGSRVGANTAVDRLTLEAAQEYLKGEEQALNDEIKYLESLGLSDNQLVNYIAQIKRASEANRRAALSAVGMRPLRVNTRTPQP